MRRVKFTVSLARTTLEGEAKFPDDATDEEIQEHYLEWRNEHVDGGWEEME